MRFSGLSNILFSSFKGSISVLNPHFFLLKISLLSLKVKDKDKDKLLSSVFNSDLIKLFIISGNNSLIFIII